MSFFETCYKRPTACMQSEFLGELSLNLLTDESVVGITYQADEMVCLYFETKRDAQEFIEAAMQRSDFLLEFCSPREVTEIGAGMLLHSRDCEPIDPNWRQHTISVRYLKRKIASMEGELEALNEQVWELTNSNDRECRELAPEFAAFRDDLESLKKKDEETLKELQLCKKKRVDLLEAHSGIGGLTGKA